MHCRDLHHSMLRTATQGPTGILLLLNTNHQALTYLNQQPLIIPHHLMKSSLRELHEHQEPTH